MPSTHIGVPHLAGLCTPQVRVGVGLTHCKGSKAGREPVSKWVFKGGLWPGTLEQ